MNIVILSSFHTSPHPPSQILVLQGISEQQITPYTMHTHIPCCPGTAATLDLASLDTAAVAWRYKTAPSARGFKLHDTHRVHGTGQFLLNRSQAKNHKLILIGMNFWSSCGPTPY